MAALFLNAHLNDQKEASSMIISQIEIEFEENLDEFKTQIELYARAASNGQPIQEIREIHRQSRLSFKKVEFLLEYLDPAGIKQRINGAPLPKTEPKVADLNIIEPKGLQTLDEILFESPNMYDYKQTQKLLVLLKKDVDYAFQFANKINLTHQMIFEAMRLELIRIFTLGVTGFDTPGSLNALEEAYVALHAVFTVYQKYIPMMKEGSLGSETTYLFNKGLHQLGADVPFGNFDRLEFLMEVINPIYKNILLTQEYLQIEKPNEVRVLPSAISYEATNLFSPNFLNALYYDNLSIDSLMPERTELGEKLFYDPLLSKNLKMSCSTCHDPNQYFTDGLQKSISSIDGQTLIRNAPTLINAVYAEKYFYDLREEIFEKQIKHVVTSHKEFDTDYVEIMDKLSDHKEYNELFNNAYPGMGISSHSIANSIAHYVAGLVSFDSPFDRFVLGKSEHLSDDAKTGFNLFMGKAACGTCHFAPTFSGLVPPLYQESESEVLGIPSSKANTAIDSDPGRVASGKPLDEAPFYVHSFKTTTVRNIEFTGPYMHNGVYDTLEEVMDFYNKGGGLGLGLDVEYQTLSGDPLDLSEEEINQLIAFMKSLSDPSISEKY